MFEKRLICDICKHGRRPDELNISWFNFTVKNESPGVIYKFNTQECYRQICKQCVFDIAAFAREQGIFPNN